MKKFLLLTVCLLAFCPLKGQDAAEFDAEYKAGRFESALSGYLSLAEQNKKQAAARQSFFFSAAMAKEAADQKNAFLYYNIGNCYFKLGHNGLARAYYTKAYDIKPRDKAVRQNLAKSMSMAGQQMLPEGMPAALQYAFNFFSLYEMQKIMSLFLLCGAAVFCFWFFKRKGLKAVFVCLGALALFGGWYAALAAGAKGRAVVTVPTAEARSGPAPSFPAEVLAPEGYSVKTGDESGEWIFITLDGSDAEGWTDKKSIIKIEDI